MPQVPGVTFDLRTVTDAAELFNDARREDYVLFQDYYDGNHAIKLPTRVRAFLEQVAKFRNNISEVVVDVQTERLIIEGIEHEHEATGKWLNTDFWHGNDLDEIQMLVHRQAAALGDSYLFIEFDFVRNLPVVMFNDASLVRPAFSEQGGEPAFYAKQWNITRDTNFGLMEHDTRLNIYFADRIMKFVGAGDGGAVIPWMDPGDLTWPVWWTVNGTESGEPLGLPWVMFRNKVTHRNFGRSELANVIPMQDMLNKFLVDMAAAGDTQAFKQRWIAGADQPPGGYVQAPGVVWTVPAEAKVGEFQETDLMQYIKSIEMTVQHIAGRSRTPQHLFHITGTLPSGEALKSAEAGLVAKVTDRQLGFSTSWERLFEKAIKLDNAFSSSGLEDDGSPGPLVRWKSAETRVNELEHTNAVMTKAPLIGEKQALRELGYTDDQVQRILEENPLSPQERMAAFAQMPSPVGGSPPSQAGGRQPEQG